MFRRLVLGTLLGFLASSLLAADPSTRLAVAIDRHLADDWKAEKITPAPIADDAEFARRVYLDLIGRIPRVSEVRTFLDDKTADKRAKIVDKLLTMPAHANHFAAVTRDAWAPSTANPQFAFYGSQMAPWLQEQFRLNTPADEMVRKVLNAAFPVAADAARNGGANFTFGTENNALLAFYRANEGKPETVASAASRLFLGVKLECAQCHDHPFNTYTREQFWEFAAFFAEVQTSALGLPVQNPGNAAKPERNKLKIPNTDRTVEAAFFDGSRPKWSDNRSPRQELAEWLTTAKNPYFAKNLANRTWAHFFGIGILDPVDEPGENNLPSHPELLEEIAKSFADAKFDNRMLIRGITMSKAYQRTSRQTHASQANPRKFARMSVRGLTPAQIYDSFVAATGYRDDGVGLRRVGGQQPGNARAEFLARFASAEKSTETQTSILQALMLMNGNAVNAQASLDRSEALAAVIDAPFFTTEQRVEAIFLAALTRQPTKDEAERFSSYVARGGVNGDKKQALADLFWVLLNSTEFLFNH